jgi:hypothetical protein
MKTSRRTLLKAAAIAPVAAMVPTASQVAPVVHSFVAGPTVTYSFDDMLPLGSDYHYRFVFSGLVKSVVTWHCMRNT